MLQSDLTTSLSEVTAPAAEPISRADAKTWMKVDTTDDDTLIDEIIAAARLAAEQMLNLQFITATYDFNLDGWPSVLRLPRAPVQSITSISYTDEDGNGQTWGSSLYQSDLASLPARIMPAFGETYPQLRATTFSPVTVRFVAGYGDAATDVPEDLVKGLSYLIEHQYSYRSAIITGTILSELPMTVQSYLKPHRMEFIG